MINVLHVTSSLKVGGAETVLCDLIELSDPQRIQATVIYFHDGPLAARLRTANVTLYHVRGLLCRYDPVFFVRLFLLIRKLQPDCIHALLWSANISCRIIARMLRIPLVSAQHNHASLEHGFRAFLDRVTLPLATKVVAVSPTVARSLTQRDAALHQRITIIPNGVQIQQLRAEASISPLQRNTLGLTHEHLIIGAVGRLHPVKNFPYLLESFALIAQRNPHVRLVIIGGGPEEHALRALAEQLGMYGLVVFVGNAPAMQYYPLFDCFVLASHQEGMSIALLEAMSFGTSCIVTHDTNLHDVITHGHNGLLVQPHNPHALATTLEQVLQQPDLRTKLGAAARQTIKRHFDVVQMATKYSDLFSEISNKNTVL